MHISAGITEHFGSVRVPRFSNCRRYLRWLALRLRANNKLWETKSTLPVDIFWTGFHIRHHASWSLRVYRVQHPNLGNSTPSSPNKLIQKIHLMSLTNRRRLDKLFIDLLVIFSQFFLPVTQPLPFNITHFNGENSNTSYGDDATALNGAIVLNRDDSPPAPLARQLNVRGLIVRWTSLPNFLSTWRMLMLVSSDGGGLAFFLAPRWLPPDSAGGDLGLFNRKMFAFL